MMANGLKFSLLLFFYNHTFLFSQISLIDEYKYQIICSEDTINKCTLDGFENFYIYTYSRQNEYFSDHDTLKKDFILYEESLYTFDDLLRLKQRNYTVSFSLENIYLVRTKKHKFLVLQGFNSFQIGSDQQTFFIVLKIFDESVEVVSSYILDATEDSDSIRLIKRFRSLKLKHKKLKLLK